MTTKQHLTLTYIVQAICMLSALVIIPYVMVLNIREARWGMVVMNLGSIIALFVVGVLQFKIRQQRQRYDQHMRIVEKTRNQITRELQIQASFPTCSICGKVDQEHPFPRDAISCTRADCGIKPVRP